MPKSSKYKGQWFLLSAVFATGAFLAISLLFRSYFVVDTSATAKTNEQLYFNNIRNQAQYLIDNNCGNLIDGNTKFERDFNELQSVAEREMANIGYGVKMGYSWNGCGTKIKLIVASNRAVICQNYSKDEVKSVISRDPDFGCLTT